MELIDRKYRILQAIIDDYILTRSASQVPERFPENTNRSSPRRPSETR